MMNYKSREENLIKEGCVTQALVQSIKKHMEEIQKR